MNAFFENVFILWNLKMLDDEALEEELIFILTELRAI